MSSTISAYYFNNFNSSSGSESVSMNPSIFIGAAVGGALCLVAAIGGVWIIRRNKTRTSQKRISATTEIVKARDSVQVRAWCTIFPLTERFFSVISDRAIIHNTDLRVDLVQSIFMFKSSMSALCKCLACARSLTRFLLLSAAVRR